MELYECTTNVVKQEVVYRALREGLYEKDEQFELFDWMLDIYGNDFLELDSINVVVMHVCGIFVGIAISGSTDNTVSVYVKPKYRKQGIGRMLLEALPNKDSLIAEEGIEGSLEFFKKCGVKTEENQYE